MSIKADTARKYIKRFPKTSIRALARKLYKDNPELYTDIEDARGRIRYCVGSQGENSRKKVSGLITKAKRTANPLDGFPEGDKYFKDGWSPISLGGAKVAVLSDLHVPYHDKEACLAAIKHAKKQGCTDVLINGDFLDIHNMSKFCKDPRKKNFAQELKYGKDILNRIRDTFSGDITLKLGNHDERYEHFLYNKAAELLDVEDFEMDRLLRLDEIGVRYVKDKRRIKLGKLWVIHGHELPRGISDPVNPARGLYLRTKTTSLCGHWHRTSEHTETSMDEEMVTCWSTGCLCDLRPEYSPINKWNHGFAIVTVEASGDFEVDNYRILNGKVL